jgi:transposase InsO family protein
MKGIKPEVITGEFAIIGRRHYPVKQVGEVVTRQDGRDFSAAEMTRALRDLGFTCRTIAPPAPAAAVAVALTPSETAASLLGIPVTA